MQEQYDDDSLFTIQVFSSVLSENVAQARDALAGETTLSNSKKTSEKVGVASLKENVCQVNHFWMTYV